MAHPSQQKFIESTIKKLVPNTWYYNVLDCGSLDINGNNKVYFSGAFYIGLDLGPGKNVDLIGSAHSIKFKTGFFDVVLSTEMLEHDINWRDSLKNMVRMLKSKGVFILTCATTGRKEHGTKNTDPKLSPFTNNYYMNITEKHIREALNIEDIFSEYKFQISNEYNLDDLYFYGIKK